MRRFSVIVGVLLAALLATSGVASAAKPPLTLEAGGEPLAPGAALSATSSNFTVSSLHGSVTCTNTTLGGTLQSNGGSSFDSLQIEAASFQGEAAEGLCAATYPAPVGEEVLVLAPSLPWTVQLTSKGQVIVRSELLLEIGPPEKPNYGHPALSCKYSAKNRKGTFLANGEPLTVTFTEAKLKRDPNSAKPCDSSKPKLSGTFAISSGGEPVTAVLG